ncbi:MAG: sugar phosphate isomerase/epimerase [Planctomycetes bacterium]|nr:sugar phosphate isomerase/epimerase [Planctomycetota bacterium]
MLLGYNTNGFAFHRLEDAIDIIADCGYHCVALTLDVHHLDPFNCTPADVHAVAAQLGRRGLSCVIETGSRYLLDARRKHRPTLIDDDPEPRIQFLHRAAEIAEDLGALCISYWSGARPEDGHHTDEELFRRLTPQIGHIESVCQNHGVRAALEPEPGMLVATMADYERLSALCGGRPGLTLDIGHLKCLESNEPHEYLSQYQDVLYNVQLDDMLPGRHQHLFFGEGAVRFEPVFKTLAEIGFKGPACVELSDASRNAVETARRAKDFLDRFKSLSG